MGLKHEKLNFKVGFEALECRLAKERAERLATPKIPLSLGVNFLNAALGGILPNDLILLGAKSGIGKTQLATIIAMENARLGKRVHFFALEAEQYEIERRVKYRMLADAYYSAIRNGVRATGHINYMDWRMGRLEEVFSPYEQEIDRLFHEFYGELFTYYNLGSFTIDDFAKTFLSIQDQTDLVVLDHLHYIDFDDSNENRAYKQMVKTIRTLAIDIGKPVVVVAHVRKSDRKSKALVPDLDDFHGSSDIPKIATKAVMIAPAVHEGDPTLWQTYMRIAKCRADSSRTRFVGLVCFDVKKQSYTPKFVVGKLKDFDETFEEITDLSRLPYWAVEEKVI